MWEENWIAPWRSGVTEMGSGDLTGAPGLVVASKVQGRLGGQWVWIHL